MGSKGNSEGNESKAKNNDNGKSQDDGYYAFDLYPERRRKNLGQNLKEFFSYGPKGERETAKFKCEQKVYQKLTKEPLIRLMINALKKAGCPFNIGRNISCEVCDSSVTGGYDQELNQIVVCQNSSKVRNTCAPTLIHELIHMFDYCVHDVDFKNIEHLACTEIRAANLTHCSFLSSFFLAQSTLFKVKQTHQYCVKMKATQSLMVSRNLDFNTALKEVLKVFDKCYNDLEPIGRRIRRNSPEPDLAYFESVHYGYTDPIEG